MSRLHTIDTVELTNHENVLKMISEIQNQNTNFFLVQDGVEVARIIPVEAKDRSASEKLKEKRFAVLEEMEILSKRVAQLWKTEETAAEAVANDRRWNTIQRHQTEFSL